MAKKSLNGVLQHLRHVAAVRTHRALGDDDLLQRFVTAHDEAAFTVLVERHGPMVLGVCRRALGNIEDAEDACQATFLVLARKAGAIRNQKSISHWLHGVACRIAANLLRRHARRQRRERQVQARPCPDAASEVSWREVQAVLDQELQQLPEKFRAPLILCYLEGKTRDEAAERLGVSAGSLHGRLERGRDLLRRRLTSRGLSLSAALLATALCAGAAPAALSPTLVVASTKAGLAVAAGQTVPAGVIPAKVLTLSQEVLKTMFLAKLKLGAALVLSAGLIAALIGASLPSVGLAQDAKGPHATAVDKSNPENDADFIRRVSQDLRGVPPTPAEVHFFLAAKDGNKRQKLIDLFIQERQSKKEADKLAEVTVRQQAVLALSRIHLRDKLVEAQTQLARVHAATLRLPRYATLQGNFYKDLQAAKEKKEVATITQNYLDRLMAYVKDHAKNDDVPDAMLQIVIVYGSLGKTVESNAWRDKLLKEHPQSPAAKNARDIRDGRVSLQGQLDRTSVLRVIDLNHAEVELTLPRLDVPKN